jgi:hypothetical protein
LRAPFPLGAAVVLAVLLGAVTYGGILLSLWRWTGCPQGIEAMAIGKITALIKRLGPQTVRQIY